jgi:mannose-6-phosphate isomerase-like protein (cupin superfamily)
MLLPQGRFWSGLSPSRRSLGPLKLTSVAAIPIKPNPHGIEAMIIYDRDDGQIPHRRLMPGLAVKKRNTSIDVVFYVLEGRGDVEIGEEREMVEKDTLVESPAGIPHFWRNVADVPLYMVMKLPPSAEKTKMAQR